MSLHFSFRVGWMVAAGGLLSCQGLVGDPPSDSSPATGGQAGATSGAGGAGGSSAAGAGGQPDGGGGGGSCEPLTCADILFPCGTHPDECGGTITCGEPCECTFAYPFWQEPWCYCEPGWRPLGSKHNGKPEQTGNNGQQCGATCGSATLDVPVGTVSKQARGRSNAKPGGSVMFFAEDHCTQGSDYVASPPAAILASLETQHAPNAAGCCIEPEDGVNGGIGAEILWWDFAGWEGQQIYIGVYNDEATDCVSGIDVCLQCDAADQGYPDYGTGIDQCSSPP